MSPAAVTKKQPPVSESTLPADEADEVTASEAHKKQPKTLFTGATLEAWRLHNALTSMEGAEAFALPIAKWYDLVRRENLKKPLADPVLALLRTLYTEYPESAPRLGRPDIPAFYEFLGFSDTPEDKKEFARLIGRESPSAYRLLSKLGKPSRPLVRYIESLLLLKLSGKQTRRVMGQIAGMVYVVKKS